MYTARIYGGCKYLLEDSVLEGPGPYTYNVRCQINCMDKDYGCLGCPHNFSQSTTTQYEMMQRHRKQD